MDRPGGGADGPGVGKAAIEGLGSALISSTSVSGDRGLVLVGDKVTSLRTVSQLDDDILPPSNCRILLLLAITEDQVQALAASVIVSRRFSGRSGVVGIELAGEHTQSQHEPEQ